MLSDEEFDSLGFTFIWRIENFSYCLEKNGKFIESPGFVLNSSTLPYDSKTKWCFQIYPRGKPVHDSVGYNIRKSPFYGTNCCNLDYQLSILASDGSLQDSIACETGMFHQGHRIGEAKLIAHDEMFGKKKNLYLTQDTLTLHCRMWHRNQLSTLLGQGFARTRIGVEKRSFIWSIKNFSTVELEKYDKIFVIEPSFKEELSLRLYVTNGSECDEKIQIGISETDAKQANLTSFKISLVDSEGFLIFSTVSEHWFEKKEGVQTCFSPMSFSKNSLLANKNLYLKDDTLSLQCDCVFSIGVVYSELELHELGPYAKPHVNSFIPEVHQHRRSRNESVEKVPHSLKTDLLSLYAEKTLCDFRLTAGYETFPVHKTLLSAPGLRYFVP